MRMEERAAGRGRGIRQQANIRDEGAAYSRARESKHEVESDHSRTKPPRARSARNQSRFLLK
ncbi:MAG: hypothetical protein UY74_C0005G0027 [Candidatus Kaiserbacteria bacterium GW2011_GWC2_52_8b]|uniref:Uncharacterized protein n=2 Tax=Candidatus Kaiseribacteriota TaxID=1752734 RepID=A0A0G1XLT8_9BACT|nr:MAG: hypothetical protein UY67_C0014G0026 [Candidatus Kaiserbacteria bacterium GW2011_GWA2_52_12]KKW31861.1 MAG: hypothetical protein UY74_C0005G0027 [Candidatus Kaiserbacteria bacterium GW2011_GWC2_52_8b]